MIVKLSDAQRSALECADLSESPTVRLCWSVLDRSKLVFGLPGERDKLLSELTDLSNSEDAQHQEQGCPMAARAAKSLAVIGQKVMKA